MVTTTFTSTHDINFHGIELSVGTSADYKSPENILPFAYCSHICSACKPVPNIGAFDIDGEAWLKTADALEDGGKRLLTEESYFECLTGGMAKVSVKDPGQDSIRLGDQKSIRALLEELEGLNEELSQRYHTPDVMDELARKQEIEQEILSRTPYNEVQFTSSHNSYESDTHGGRNISEQFRDNNIHSFELDFHNGNPDGYTSDAYGNLIPLPDWQPPGDFCVYHASVDQGTAYPELLTNPENTNGCVISAPILNEINNLPTNYPVTLFIDMKNDPLDDLNSDDDNTTGTNQMNTLLNNSFGDNLYTPNDLIQKAQQEYPNIEVNTLAQAVDLVGMPTMADLEGKVIVVLTDKTDTYTNGANINEQSAFVAGKPHIENGNITDDNMIFFNIGKPKKEFLWIDTWIQKEEYEDEQLDMLAAIDAHGYISRGYYFHGDDFLYGESVGLNHIATDDVGNGWNDLSQYGFPFKIKENFLMIDEHQTQQQEGKLAVISGATLTCPKAVMGSDVKFFRMNK